MSTLTSDVALPTKLNTKIKKIKFKKLAVGTLVWPSQLRV